MKKRLYRSQADRQIAGVCGGLSDYFNVDPTLIRLLFILFTFIGGPGLIVYIALWLVMPDENNLPVRYETGKRKNDEELV